ncbi:hypothetical protein DF159_21230 [Burkholderia ubonensis]|nr:hypothetical protein CJO70_17415 [Burkholderia ubonensis]PAJ93403.1 hypothetical protein CJO69_17125 [Burkholderia ubonensis]RQP34216.1 hypothetical protein DF154_24355 [Burkholderia ubonensis]RQP58062.1 hypothetical protein DF159_21230 [Burkholderia ubonensis]RQP75577.1 hypothetical protein DF014_27000 [Burkholderia ubonensis]
MHLRHHQQRNLLANARKQIHPDSTKREAYNGPEFVRKALDAWAHEHGVKLQFIRPGKPVENAHIESFNGRLRGECLNQHAFVSLDDARGRIEAWRTDYNSVRPHSALGQLAPDQFRQLHQPKTGEPTNLRMVYSAGVRSTDTSEPAMTSFVRVRACPNPNNFFDEIVPENGLTVCDWRLTIRRIAVPGIDPSGAHTVVDTAWLYAESDYDEAQLARFRHDKLATFMQIVQALAGLRRMHLTGGVQFSMFFEEFVKDGVSRNIEPHQVNIGVGILRVRATDATGTVVFDARAMEVEQARRALQDAKNELRMTGASVVKHLGDDFFRRAWESFNLAFGADEHAINHLYDVRDAVTAKFGKDDQARKALGIHKSEWSEFGKIFNDGAVKGGRHNGKHPAPLRPMSREQRDQIIRFAKELLRAYGRYLDNQAIAPQEQAT